MTNSNVEPDLTFLFFLWVESNTAAESTICTRVKMEIFMSPIFYKQAISYMCVELSRGWEICKIPFRIICEILKLHMNSTFMSVCNGMRLKYSLFGFIAYCLPFEHGTLYCWMNWICLPDLRSALLCYCSTYYIRLISIKVTLRVW